MPVYVPNQGDINDILAGKQTAGARLIRSIEDGDPGARQVLKALYPHAGQGFVIGITGSPGVGKSTLVDRLITEFRQLKKKVAVIAVDPSSPVSGGAILGDRLRMQKHASDDKVFIRSMASRGRQGGLSRTTKDAVIVLDAMGYDIIIIETAGAGQSEVDVSELAHSVGIISIPGAGDGIQAIKAGILETGDIYIVNKCERPEAEAAIFELSMMLDYRHYDQNDRKPVILKTEALKGTGVKELAGAFLSHYEFLKQKGLLAQKQKEMDLAYFKNLVRDLVLEKIITDMENSENYREAFNKIGTGGIDPLNAAEQVVGLINLGH